MSQDKDQWMAQEDDTHPHTEQHIQSLATDGDRSIGSSIAIIARPGATPRKGKGKEGSSTTSSGSTRPAGGSSLYH